MHTKNILESLIHSFKKSKHANRVIEPEDLYCFYEDEFITWSLLAPEFPKFSRLRSLSLSDISLGDDGIKRLTQAYTSTPCQIESYNLSNNKIGPLGAQLLAGLIQVPNSQVKTLNLYQNNLYDEGAFNISTAIHKLTDLNLSRNQISNIGVFHIARFLYRSSLVSLSLAQNNIGDEASKLFEKLNQTLKFLNLSQNHISNKAVLLLTHLIKNIQVPIALTELCLFSNPLSKDTAFELNQALNSQQICHIQTDLLGHIGLNLLPLRLMKHIEAQISTDSTPAQSMETDRPTNNACAKETKIIYQQLKSIQSELTICSSIEDNDEKVKEIFHSLGDAAQFYKKYFIGFECDISWASKYLQSLPCFCDDLQTHKSTLLSLCSEYQKIEEYYGKTIVACRRDLQHPYIEKGNFLTQLSYSLLPSNVDLDILMQEASELEPIAKIEAIEKGLIHYPITKLIFLASISNTEILEVNTIPMLIHQILSIGETKPQLDIPPTFIPESNQIYCIDSNQLVALKLNEWVVQTNQLPASHPFRTALRQLLEYIHKHGDLFRIDSHTYLNALHELTDFPKKSFKYRVYEL